VVLVPKGARHLTERVNPQPVSRMLKGRMPLAPLTIVLFLAVSAQDAASAADCSSWTACRDAALAAEARQDFETFHDLAWRTMQKGARDNFEIMLLLARAQSSSGRPLDALVMLRRLAEKGANADVSGDGFARVRSLPGWEDLERRLAAGPERVTSTGEGSVDSTAPKPDTAEPSVRPKPEAAAIPAGPKPEAATAPTPAKPDAAVSEALRFTTAAFTPAGLAYDAVSRRFIVGDRQARKLAVVDEFSHHVANLAGSQATGFGEIAALEIDAREGNLWVVTGDGPEASNGKTTLHKLQLISARALTSFTPPDNAGQARFTDVAIAADGTVLALDAVGRRLFRLRPRGTELQHAASLGDRTPRSLAPTRGDVVYVTHEDGIQRVDLASGQATDVAVGAGVSLAGIGRIRWHGRALVGIQRAGAGHRAVRLALDGSGRRVTRLEVLDPSIEAASPAATCISSDGLYYLAAGADGQMIIRRVELE
jgi:hypothetical protein